MACSQKEGVVGGTLCKRMLHQSQNNTLQNKFILPATNVQSCFYAGQWV